jgi:leader peptidase (prepilin peptidase) / N-methyltransferase
VVVLFIFLLGLIFGSFANVLIYRLPLGLTLSGRSYCPSCKNKISWFDNVPLLSFFLLRRKCRSCNQKISFQYPLVEFICGLGFVLMYLLFINLSNSFLVSIKGNIGFWVLPYLLFIFVILLAIFVIDLKKRIIPDGLSYALLIIVLIYLLIAKDIFFVNLFSGFVCSLFLLFLHLVTKGKGMGLGDVKFVLFGGMFFGFPLSLLWLFVSFLTGALVGVILILVKKAKFGKEIAFGPFLIIGFYLTLIWGETILKLLF